MTFVFKYNKYSNILLILIITSIVIFFLFQKRLSEHFEPEEEPDSRSTENPGGSVSPTSSVENLPYLNVTPGRPVRTLTNEGLCLTFKFGMIGCLNTLDD